MPNPVAVGPEAPPAERGRPVKKDLAAAANVLGVLAFCTMGVTAVIGLVVAVFAVVRAVRHPERQRMDRAVASLAANLLIVVMMAIALPPLLRAKPSALFAATLGDVRTVISAEAAYAEKNGGLYEARLECLARPATCLPDYPKEGPPFLDEALSSLREKAGYRRTFYPGPSRPGSSRPGIVSFAYTAVPVTYQDMEGLCGDSTGTICTTRDGAEPQRTRDGLCDLSTCKVLR